MSAVLKDTATTLANRQRLVKEIARFRSDGERDGQKFAAALYQRKHDVELAEAALRKAQRAAGDAQTALQTFDFGIQRAISSLEAELLSTAPREIDALILELEQTMERFKNVLIIPEKVRMSDGSTQVSEASTTQYRHSVNRWETLTDSVRQLHAMKLEAFSDADLRKRLDAIQSSVAAALYLAEG